MAITESLPSLRLPFTGWFRARPNEAVIPVDPKIATLSKSLSPPAIHTWLKSWRLSSCRFDLVCDTTPLSDALIHQWQRFSNKESVVAAANLAGLCSAQTDNPNEVWLSPVDPTIQTPKPSLLIHIAFFEHTHQAITNKALSARIIMPEDFNKPNIEAAVTTLNWQIPKVYSVSSLANFS